MTFTTGATTGKGTGTLSFVARAVQLAITPHRPACPRPELLSSLSESVKLSVLLVRPTCQTRSAAPHFSAACMSHQHPTAFSSLGLLLDTSTLSTPRFALHSATVVHADRTSRSPVCSQRSGQNLLLSSRLVQRLVEPNTCHPCHTLHQRPDIAPG